MHGHKTTDLPSSDTPKRGMWGILKVLGPYLWPKDSLNFRIRFILATTCLFLGKITAISIPFLFKKAVDTLTLFENLSSTEQILSIPTGLLIAYGLVRIISALFTEGRDLIFSRLEQHALRSISRKVFHHLHTLSLRYHLDRKTGGLNRSIERGAEGIETALRFLTFNIIPTFVEILLVCLFLLCLYPPLFSFITFLTMGFYGVFTIWITEWRTKYVRAMNVANEEGNTKAIDSLLNYETVKYFGNEPHEEHRFDLSLKTYECANIRMKQSLAALNIGQAIIIALGMTWVMILAAQGIENHNLTVGDFVLMNAYLFQLYLPLSNLGFSYRETKRAFVNMEAMFGLLKIPQEIQDQRGALDLKTTDNTVVFDHVSFSYNPNRLILDDISFKIPTGRMLAIVGSSGAGKSTIARLLFRFYDPTAGKILIDGYNIKDVTQKSLRANIGVVPQDTVLFNDTLLYNVRYGNITSSLDEVKKAAHLAELTSFIDILPNGYNTEVGERGLKLSGGEKQRVAIARALLKNPDIFIFDEATSSLDSHTEKEIQRNIRRISKDHTTLIIAHRLSTIIDADEILVLDKGKIAERGTHHDLLEENGIYTHLWKQQHKKTSL